MTTKRIKRANYKEAISWIALNDEPTLFNVSDIAQLISVQLCADLWGKYPTEIATDIVRYRSRYVY